jgi:hypothetical protein
MVTERSQIVPIITLINVFFVPWESEMGNSLHNKIPLGRSSVRDSRALQAALLAGALLSAGLVWMALRLVQ